jgi:FlaA1/EpsC-like NDP-sugar epimerase
MKVLVTGITGTIGSVLADKLLFYGHEVVGISRDEFKQAKFQYKNECEMVLGDIRDLDSCIRASRGCDAIIHTAALKHVDLMEKHPMESYKTNVVGTDNLLKCQRKFDIKQLVLLSTDKAVYPINVYGNTKAIAEKLVLSNPENLVVRYGNVLNSRGSVLELFKKQIPKKLVTLTHEKMTRFWVTIEDVAEFIIDKFAHEKTGIHIPDMKASSIKGLVKAIKSGMGVLGDIEYKTIGMRPGEKINECLYSRYEKINNEEISRYDLYSDRAEQYHFDELVKKLEDYL